MLTCLTVTNADMPCSLLAPLAGGCKALASLPPLLRSFPRSGPGKKQPPASRRLPCAPNWVYKPTIPTSCLQGKPGCRGVVEKRVPQSLPSEAFANYRETSLWFRTNQSKELKTVGFGLCSRLAGFRIVPLGMWAWPCIGCA